MLYRDSRTRNLGLALIALAALGLGFPGASAAQYTKKPSNIVELGTTVIAATNTATVVEITPTGSNGGTFTVPSGQVFVLTSLSIFPETYVAGSLAVQLIQNSAVREFFRVSSAEPTQLQFPVGVVIASGYSLSVRNVFAGDPSVRIKMTGYLAPDV